MSKSSDPLQQARARQRALVKLLADEKADLASLADADRQLHVEKDRKSGEIENATGAHKDALKRVVGILDHDIEQVRGRIHGHRDMRKRHRAALRKVRKRIRWLKHHRGGEEIHGNGPDVSVYQGSVDWKAVATKCEWAAVKATEGATYTDPTFSAARIKAMQDAGLAIMLYHFARPAVNSPEREAQNFYGAAKAAGVDFSSELAEWYGGGYSLDPALSALDRFLGVWISGYPHYIWTGPDAAIDFHQFTDRGVIPGVGSPCDVSVVVAPPKHWGPKLALPALDFESPPYSASWAEGWASELSKLVHA